MEKIDFKNLPDTSTPFTAENFNQLQTNVENAINNAKPKWVEVPWTEEASGGTITTNMSLLNKLVSLEFINTNNQYHSTSVVLYWRINNYQVANMGGTILSVIANATTDTGFTLIIPDNIKLSKIRYLQL